MITESLSTLKIHKLSQAQYEREKAAGNIDEYALYLTPDDGSEPGSSDLGDADISAIGDGTVTGAIAALNTTLLGTQSAANEAHARAFDSSNVLWISDATTLMEVMKQMPNSSIKFGWSWSNISDADASLDINGGFHVYMFIKHKDGYNRIIDFGTNCDTLYIGRYDHHTDSLVWSRQISSSDFTLNGNSLTLNFL